MFPQPDENEIETATRDEASNTDEPSASLIFNLMSSPVREEDSKVRKVIQRSIGLEFGMAMAAPTTLANYDFGRQVLEHGTNEVSSAGMCFAVANFVSNTICTSILTTDVIKTYSNSYKRIEKPNRESRINLGLRISNGVFAVLAALSTAELTYEFFERLGDIPNGAEFFIVINNWVASVLINHQSLNLFTDEITAYCMSRFNSNYMRRDALVRRLRITAQNIKEINDKAIESLYSNVFEKHQLTSLFSQQQEETEVLPAVSVVCSKGFFSGTNVAKAVGATIGTIGPFFLFYMARNAVQNLCGVVNIEDKSAVLTVSYILAIISLLPRMALGFHYSKPVYTSVYTRTKNWLLSYTSSNSTLCEYYRKISCSTDTAKTVTKILVSILCIIPGQISMGYASYVTLDAENYPAGVIGFLSVCSCLNMIPVTVMLINRLIDEAFAIVQRKRRDNPELTVDDKRQQILDFVNKLSSNIAKIPSDEIDKLYEMMNTLQSYEMATVSSDSDRSLSP